MVEEVPTEMLRLGDVLLQLLQRGTKNFLQKNSPKNFTKNFQKRHCYIQIWHSNLLQRHPFFGRFLNSNIVLEDAELKAVHEAHETLIKLNPKGMFDVVFHHRSLCRDDERTIAVNLLNSKLPVIASTLANAPTVEGYLLTYIKTVILILT